jgi:hypothetical protein
MNSFFTLHSFSEVGKTQDLPSKFWQTLGDALKRYGVQYKFDFFSSHRKSSYGHCPIWLCFLKMLCPIAKRGNLYSKRSGADAKCKQRKLEF